MDLGLKGQVALVTGGSKGIGKAVARGLAQEGVRVAICARSKASLEAAAEELGKATGAEVFAVAGDLTRPDDVQRIVDATVSRFGRIDVLVNNAGSAPGGEILDLTEEDWQKALQLKFMGYVRCIKAVIPHMQRQGGGRIVNIVGNDGVKPIGIELSPSAANAADLAMTIALAEQYGRQNILVNAINPGPVATDGVRLLRGGGGRPRGGEEPPTRPLLPALHTLDLHVKFLAEQGIDTAVFGPLMDIAGYSLPPAQGAAWSRLQNEALAAALDEAPGEHRGLATVPLQDAVAAATELRVAVRDLGLSGAMIDPNALGRPLGDAAFDPFWKAAADLEAPVVLHPYLLEAVERFGRHYLHNLVGYPFETTLAAASLILGGTLDRFPELAVVLVHGGGFLPYHIGRFDRAHRTRPEARVDDAGLPSHYLRRFLYDTLVQRPDALRYLVQLVGHDRVMLGSDHPFWLGDPDPLRVVREAGLAGGTAAPTPGGNAARLFRLVS